MVPVGFNPWRLGSETEMFVGFFETLAEALDAELTTGVQKVGELLSATAAPQAHPLHRRCRRRGGSCCWRSPVGNQPGQGACPDQVSHVGTDRPNVMPTDHLRHGDDDWDVVRGCCHGSSVERGAVRILSGGCLVTVVLDARTPWLRGLMYAPRCRQTRDVNRMVAVEWSTAACVPRRAAAVGGHARSCWPLPAGTRRSSSTGRTGRQGTADDGVAGDSPVHVLFVGVEVHLFAQEL